MTAPLRQSATKLVEKIRSLLATRGLSLADVCRESRTHSADIRLGHVPHNLYDAIRKRQFTPSIFQIASLSTLSGYRFIDWLKLFSFVETLAKLDKNYCKPSDWRKREIPPQLRQPKNC